MLWRRRRRALVVAHFVGCLALVPAFALVVWSAGDGPSALPQLEKVFWLPAVRLTDVGIVLPILGTYIGILRVYQLMDDIRAQAIAGDVDAIPPAKPLALEVPPSMSLPITLVWEQARRSRVGLTIGFLVTLAAYVGLGVFVSTAGLFGYVFSLQGTDFWDLFGVIALCAIFPALIPLTFMYAAMRGKRGIVADSLGVRDWNDHSASHAIAWADARLLEEWGGRNKFGGALTYSLYARDGRRLRWMARTNASRNTSSQKPVTSDINDSRQQTAALLDLAASHAGLIPRTFDDTIVDRSSNLAAPGNALLSKEVVADVGGGSAMLLLGLTAGCGLATLAYHSLLTPASSLLCATTLGLSAVWSLVSTVRDLLGKPHRLSPEERPQWQALQRVAAQRRVRLRQSRNRLHNWPLATRAALLLLGSVAGLATIISALVGGSGEGDPFVTWYSIIWLALTLLFACLRLSGQFERDRVDLMANSEGLRNLCAPAEPPTPWTKITSLRFTWSRVNGFQYVAATSQGDEFTWASQSRLWRDEVATGASDLNAASVDGDTFAAIVAARTGITPAQALLS